MPTIVTLGTGTGIGKTYATATLSNLLTGRLPSDRLIALKPIESGVSTLTDTDAATLGARSRPPCAPRHAFAMREAISPHLAASRESKVITTQAIIEWVAARENQLKAGWCINNQTCEHWTLIETAGGAFTPLSRTLTNVSIAQAFEPAIWVLIAPDRLGVLHELRATLTAMETVARLPDVLLLNAPETPDESTGTNRREIEDLGIAKVTGEIPRNASLNLQDEARLLKCLCKGRVPR